MEQIVMQLVRIFPTLLDKDLHLLILQEGAFALVCKSSYYPGEVVATRRGSPLLVGIRSDRHVITDNLPVCMSSLTSTLTSC